MESDRIIRFNVGGTIFETRKSTITTAGKGTMLEAMLSGQYAVEKDESGCIFLDRDPTHFRRILNYLRTDKIVLPESKSERLELLLESQYYGAQEVEAKVLTALGLSEREASLILHGTGPALIFTNLDWQPGPVTVEFWVKTKALRQGSIFWFRGFSNGHSSRFQMHAPWSDGCTYFDYGGQSGEFASGPARVVAQPLENPFEWHHIAATSHADGERGMRLYVDGSLVAETWSSDAPMGAATTLLIGGESAYFHSGALRDFRIWNTVRSGDQIKENMNAKLTGKESNLWFFLPLNKPVPSGESVVDLAGGFVGQMQPGNASWSQDTTSIFDA